MMTNEDWKKNDALMKAALKKMNLCFSRNYKTWEATVKMQHLKNSLASCYDANDNFVDEGPNTPESLGEIKYFYVTFNHLVNNIFYGVKSYEELKIKLDLMA